MARLGILTLHGMGNVGPDFDKVLQEELRQRWSPSIRNDIAFQSLHYHPEMQGEQEATLERMNNAHRLRWDKLRAFFIYAFSDATTYHLFPEKPDSVYQKVHNVIKKGVEELHDRLESPNNPIVIIAQSLGAQIVSNYIWDLQQRKGIWQIEEPSDIHQLKSLKLIITTGCNIPIFVAGLETITPIQKTHDDFRWLNFFDEDDVLGWPLKPLSKDYEDLVEDRPIQAGTTPLSHIRYWRDRDFLNPAAIQIEDLYKQHFNQ